MMSLTLLSGRLEADSRSVLLYDLNTDQVSDSEKVSILSEIQVLLTNQTPLRVIDRKDVADAVVVENPMKEKLQLLILSQQKRYQELQEMMKEAKEFYRASNFIQARDRLLKIWKGLETTPLVVEAKFAVETLSYLGAVSFYLGDGVAQKAYFSTIWDLGVPSLFPQRNFPPNIVSVFNEQEEEERARKTPLSFSSNVADFELVFLGTKIPVSKVGGAFKVFLPIGQRQLTDQALHFRAQGHIPLIYRMDELPAVLVFESLEDRTSQTQLLFRPIFASSPSSQLMELASRLKANLILLGDVKKDLAGQWIGRFQWLDAQTAQASGVIEILAKNQANFNQLLRGQLLSWLSPEGFIVTREKYKATPRSGSSRAEEASITSQWWFWSLVGLGAAAAGTGTYFLLKPGNSVKFVVEPAQ